MKKKFAFQSAPARRNPGEGGFFNVRVLIGLFAIVAGVLLALAALGTFSGITANSAQAQQQKHKIIDIQGLPPGFDCSQIRARGLDRMENFRAHLIMVACGEAPVGKSSPATRFSSFVKSLLPSSPAFGSADVDLVNNPSPEVGTRITQS